MNKVFFKLDIVNDYPPVSVESIWAEELEGDRFRVKNIPFYTKEVSLGDDIFVYCGIDGELIFKEIVTASDNSTLRIVFFDNGEEKADEILKDLINIGCDWEGMRTRLYSVNVPGKVNLDNLLILLDEYVKNGWLDYEYGMIRQ